MKGPVGPVTWIIVTFITLMSILIPQTESGPSQQQVSTQKARTIETAIFVDYFLMQRFAQRIQDLKRLVMATMNEVQLIYNYQSMKVPIRIVIVKFEILNSQTQGVPNTADGDIDKYLDNFCLWQQKKLRSPGSKWDHALMLTGLDLYKDTAGRKNKKVLGLAWVNGMCKPAYSCTLNEGKSFEAAFVIAHEMAHSLGILHDGKGNNCDPEKFLMSEKTGPGKVNWSPCSNKYLENFLAKGNARCLDNDAVPVKELDFAAVNRLPGEQYGPDLQCQLALGTEYKAYYSTKEPFNDICRELWCLSGSWATPAHPALEGSSCGNGNRCFQGACTSRSLVRRQTPVGSGSEKIRSVTRFTGLSPGNLNGPQVLPFIPNRRPSSNPRLRITFGFPTQSPRRRKRGRIQSRSMSSDGHLMGSALNKTSLIDRSSPSSVPFLDRVKGLWSSFVREADSLLKSFSSP